MVVIKHLPAPPFQEQLIEELRGAGTCYHPDISSNGCLVLQESGVTILPMQEGEVTDGTLLIPEASGNLEHLNQIAIRLLGPGGCPWDQAQTHESLKRYLLEESYELFQAIDDKNKSAMIEELGDVLLQPLMHAEMAALAGEFTLADVCDSIVSKLIRRHPHVFGDVEATTEAEVLRNWDSIKSQEKSSKQESSSILAGIPNSLPALLRAYEISKRAARSGFEWENESEVWMKFDEELQEFMEAVESGDTKQIQAEMGDLLFTLVNIARHHKIEPEESLQITNQKFSKRFEFMETHASKPLRDLSLAEWDDLWNQAKVSQRLG